MTDSSVETPNTTAPQEIDQVVIRFAGDSGDGMQLTGGELTRTSAIMGNDLATFPDFPAEIRAPAGTVPGVSAFQVRFASFDIHTPGDAPDVLVAMNPAALKVHIGALKPGGVLIVNTAKFKEVDLKKAKYDSNPLEGDGLDAYRVIEIDLETVTRQALEDSPLDTRSKDRCKNMFALGILYWLYHRDLEPTLKYLDAKFGAKKPDVAEANKRVVQAGYNYADISGVFQTSYTVAPVEGVEPGTYRNIMGNQALCLGLVAASKRAGIPIVLGSYPITPASDILHQLSGYKRHGVVTFQAEDEIAAVCAAIGASYAGKIGVTSTSGPGLALKAEAIGLAAMAELPLVVVNVQRAGPSTGMPTKTEQADLLQALFGRNGECPVPVVCARTPADAFEAAFEAMHVALRGMVPVILLSDGYVANGAEPWKIPDAETLPEIKVEFAKGVPDGERFEPYARNPETLARAWAIPGTEGATHRIGGLEKSEPHGDISYDPANHEHMTRVRQEKVDRVADMIPPIEPDGGPTGDVLILGWGGTAGAIMAAGQELRKSGKSVSTVSLRWVNPFPKNLGAVLEGFEHVIIPELNGGQLAMLIRSQFLIDAVPFTKVQGLPFSRDEIVAKVEQVLTEAQS